MKSTLNPIWNHCYFEMKLTPGKEFEEIDAGELAIEVWDWDRVGSDDELGTLTFKGKELRELVEKCDKTAELGLDDNVLRTIEEEWNRLEGTPQQKNFKINVLYRIDLEAQKERERIKAANEAEKMRLLQEKIDAGLETAEERKLRKAMEKERRRRERATLRAAKSVLRKELKKRGMQSLMDRKSAEFPRSRDTKDTFRSTKDTRATGDPGDSLSAMLAAAKAEVEEDIEKGVDFEKSEEYNRTAPGGGNKSSRESRGSTKRRSRSSGGKRRASMIHELTSDMLSGFADNPDAMVDMIKRGDLELDKDAVKEGNRRERASFGEDEEEKGEAKEEAEEESDSDDDIEEGYERGVCVAFSDVLGIQVIFEDDTGFSVEKREEWIKLADIPMNVKVGKNPELQEVWRRLELEKQPLWKKIFLGKKKIYAEMDEKKKHEQSWMDKLMGRKNLGLKTYYPLYLPDRESGAKHVQGKIGIRMMYHTRGVVLRGIDEVVSNMSLGEKNLITIRADYAFGQAFGGHNLPPHSDLNVEVDLVGIRGLGGMYLFISRNINFVMHKLWLIWQLLIIIYEILICHYEKLVCPMWCKRSWVKQKKYDDFDIDDDDFDEDAMLADDSLVKSEEGQSVEVEEEQPKEPDKSTLGARLMFAKF